MPFVHGSRAALWLDDQNAICQNMKADLNSITFTRSKNNPESTTFNDNTVQRLDGQRDIVGGKRITNGLIGFDRPFPLIASATTSGQVAHRTIEGTGDQVRAGVGRRRNYIRQMRLRLLAHRLVLVDQTEPLDQH